MEWSVATLGEVCGFQGGSQPPKSQFLPNPQNGYIRLLQIRDFKSDSKAIYIPESTRNRVCQSDDIMLARYGASVGQIHRGKAGAYNVALIKTLPDTKILDNDFFYCYLLSEQFQKPLLSVAERSAQAGFSKADIAPFKIPLPPIPEQKRIVAILDQAFADIEKARANAEQNLKNARDLFDSYLQQVFSQRGEGWVEMTLGETVTFVGGSQPPKSDFSEQAREGYVRLIQIRDYKSDKRAVYIPLEKSKRYCSVDDVMIGRYGPPLFQILRGIEGSYNVALIKAVPNEALITKDFLYYFLKNTDILQYIINSSSRAAGQIGLNKKTLEPYPISFPSLDMQQEIYLEIEKLSSSITRLELIYKEKIVALDEIKKSILQKAFSGELTKSKGMAA